MVLREILCAAFAVMDGDFSPPESVESSTL
jgi:hypothetical protein